MEVMIDIETSATARNAKLLSVGACAFTSHRRTTVDEIMKRTFYANVAPYPKEQPFIESADTLAWWNKQGDEAKQVLEGNRRDAKSVLIDFAIWCQGIFDNFGAGAVWANPPQFDLAILRNHFDYFKIECPWHWSKERDFRTLREVIRQKNGFRPSEVVSSDTPNHGTVMFTKHNALHDAVMQADKVQQIIQYMRK